jgi:hypothetical protein
MRREEFFRLKPAFLSKRCCPRTLTKLDWLFQKMQLRHRWQECAKADIIELEMSGRKGDNGTAGIGLSNGKVDIEASVQMGRVWLKVDKAIFA